MRTGFPQSGQGFISSITSHPQHGKNGRRLRGRLVAGLVIFAQGFRAQDGQRCRRIGNRLQFRDADNVKIRDQGDHVAQLLEYGCV